MEPQVWIFIGGLAAAVIAYVWKRMARCAIVVDYYLHPETAHPEKTIVVVYSWGERPLRNLHVFIEVTREAVGLPDEVRKPVVAMNPPLGLLPARDSVNLAGGGVARSDDLHAYAVYRTALPWIWLQRREDQVRPRLRWLRAFPTVDDCVPKGCVRVGTRRAHLVQRDLDMAAYRASGACDA